MVVVPIRFLDPTTAVIAAGQSPIAPTAYVADRLLVAPDVPAGYLADTLGSVLADLGWSMTTVTTGRKRDRGKFAGREYTGVTVVELASEPGRLTTAPDAWVALQHLAVKDAALASRIQLDHVLAACPGSWGGVGGYWDGIGGYWDGIGGYWDGIGGYWDGIATASPAVAEFGRPGSGGRAPVSLLIADPALSAPPCDWAPTVVMLDTGIGEHPWFPRADAQGKLLVGVDPRSVVRTHGTGADDGPGVSDNLTGRLDRLAGHGTFIAGILRQICPSARLVSYAVLGSTGTLCESELLARLEGLVDQQEAALTRGDAEGLVDIITLSIGYYHEKPEDDLSDALLAKVLRDLGRAGVLVIAAAGNDATTRPLLPAGFARTPVPDTAPLLSVGSLNPNFADVSLFSNAGDWVTHLRRGAAIVSTLPVRQNASGQESTWTLGSGTRPRATIDRDDYRGGFGTWSGTSFAAPVLAGQAAARLLEFGRPDLDATALVKRAGAVVDQLPPIEEGWL